MAYPNQIELHKHHKKHRRILYTLVILLLIFNIASFIFFTIQFSTVTANVESELQRVETNLLKNIEDYEATNQRSINELSLALTQQAAVQEDFETKINLIQTGQDDFSSVIKEAVKGVVAVMTEDSMGSGFIINENGYIVTNYHVIQRGERIRVLTSENQVLQANVLGIDRLRDLALLRVEGSYPDYLKLANSDNLQVGRKVIAIGNPLGLSFTVTEGIISGLDREGPNGIQEYIQTDVPLNPGNSGGPLLDTAGDVIGINNFKIGDAESLGFALESNAIENSINAILGEEIIS